MRYVIALAALAALTACGVDGAPVPPSAESGPASARKATPTAEPGKWISGTASMHTAATL